MQDDNMLVSTDGSPLGSDLPAGLEGPLGTPRVDKIQTLCRRNN